jgi:hypothetical protein
LKPAPYIFGYLLWIAVKDMLEGDCCGPFEPVATRFDVSAQLVLGRVPDVADQKAAHLQNKISTHARVVPIQAPLVSFAIEDLVLDEGVNSLSTFLGPEFEQLQIFVLLY